MTDKRYTQTELNGLVHSAVESALTGLAPHTNSDAGGMRGRIASAISGGYDFADTLHNIYIDYGYPTSLDFFNFWNMYRRFGIARRVVELYPEQTWLDDPEVEGTPAFNTELEKLNETMGLWRRLRGLDTRQRVGRYAGMFMRVRDGLQPDKPIAGVLTGRKSLVDMVPLYESQLTVVSTETDPAQDNFDRPTMYQFHGGSVGNRNERGGQSFQIHPDRIVIASEDSDNSNIYGIPVLESIYNDLMDLRKVSGGGGEGFYKNAAQNIVFNLQDASKASANTSLLNKFNEQYDDFAQNRSRRAMWTPGMDAKTLDSNLISPKDFAGVPLMSISAGSNIPMALLTGNQTGRLAGDQDTKGFLTQVQARRTDFGTGMVKAHVDWFIKWGILPASAYKTTWPDALAPSIGEKLENADKMADINVKMFNSMGNPVFESDEIREEAGFDPEEMPDELPDETLPEGDEDE